MLFFEDLCRFSVVGGNSFYEDINYLNMKEHKC